MSNVTTNGPETGKIAPLFAQLHNCEVWKENLRFLLQFLSFFPFF